MWSVTFASLCWPIWCTRHWTRVISFDFDVIPVDSSTSTFPTVLSISHNNKSNFRPLIRVLRPPRESWTDGQFFQYWLSQYSSLLCLFRHETVLGRCDGLVMVSIYLREFHDGNTTCATDADKGLLSCGAMPEPFARNYSIGLWEHSRFFSFLLNK